MPKDMATEPREPAGRRATSPSVEMYLITVARHEEEGREGPLPLAALAEVLSISPVSANQMVRRLAERGLLEYHPYQGVLLTGVGRAAAHRVLRGRRLWTDFLTGHLGFGEEEADALACDFEHLTPPQLADRLEAFLGDGPASQAEGGGSPAGRGGRVGGRR